MKTIVLDDDPTGTQSASDVAVLLRFDADLLTHHLRRHDSVYVQTNSRAIGEREAVDLVSRVRRDGMEAARRLGGHVRFVLRGDSTLRGHVFAETDVFTGPAGVMLFVPAFPAGGRTTRDGVHYVRTGSNDVPAGETEYARDPVFGFRSSAMVDYVAELGSRPAVSVSLAAMRADGGRSVAEALLHAAPGSVVAPDAVTDADIDIIHSGLIAATDAGRQVVVRCAAPLAARCAGAVSPGLLPDLADSGQRVLVVCGSHTSGASAQLARLERDYGAPVIVDTERAIADPGAAGAAAVDGVRDQLRERGVGIVSSQRVRSEEHNTLRHGEAVMTALTSAVRVLADEVDTVIAKGGITSAEVARTGLSASTATVRGQILAGISVWDLDLGAERTLPYVVVPGNVGDEHTLAEILSRIDRR